MDQVNYKAQVIPPTILVDAFSMSRPQQQPYNLTLDTTATNYTNLTTTALGYKGRTAGDWAIIVAILRVFFAIRFSKLLFLFLFSLWFWMIFNFIFCRYWWCTIRI